jgi:ATP-dependent DNA helicase PIF1
MFLAWMESNKKFRRGRHLTYIQYPTKFVYDSDNHSWHPRKKGQSIGRLSFIPTSNRELYYMRLLLNYQVGCKSFEDIRTANGVVFNSYREACAELRLLADDREFLDLIDELSFFSSGAYLRRVYAMLLLGCSISNPLIVWEKKWEILADGILYSRKQALHNPG